MGAFVVALAFTIWFPPLVPSRQSPHNGGVRPNGCFRVLAVVLSLAGALTAQKPSDPPPDPHSIKYTINWRSRVENWDWFPTPSFQDNYTLGASVLRFGVKQNLADWDWQLELEQPSLFNLPDHAIAPAPQGALGLGGNYFASNGTEAFSIFPKTAFVRFHHYLGEHNTLRFGRFEFIEGAERSTKNVTVNQLKASRLANRLIGNFGFAHVQRSFDGGDFESNSRFGTFSLFGGRATRGVFHVDGLGELDVDTAYAAFSRATAKNDSGEWRLFAMSYHDGRRLVKVDNRPAAVRALDHDNIRIGTVGGHIVQTYALGKNKKGTAGTLDVLGWGALQYGHWGVLDHSAWSMAVEGGYQVPMRWRPWLRTGWSRASGDKNNADGTHGTFFQMLSTPRVYARFPFYNQMNNDDVFFELILRPRKNVTIRSDVHRIRLANANDLWYSGGGAFEKSSFGYAGRPSFGSNDLARVYDISVDYQVNKHWLISGYFADAQGGAIIRAIYPAGSDARLTFGELTFTY